MQRIIQYIGAVNEEMGAISASFGEIKKICDKA